MTNLPQWFKEVINLDNSQLVEDSLQAFEKSAIYAQNYKEDPTNFVDAYQFIQSHPAFWWRDEVDPNAEWHTNNYTNRVWTEALGASDAYQWALEAGRSVEGDHTHHYHDLRLDVYGIPLENAYIKLAAIVIQVFKDDGTERENIEHLDTPLLKELRARVDSWTKQKEEENKNKSDREEADSTKKDN